MTNDEARTQLAGSSRGQQLLAKLREIALVLPETSEVDAWGLPTFRVRNKIFTNLGGTEGDWTCSLKCTHDRAVALVVTDPRFCASPHVGQHGWVYLSLEGRIKWSEVGTLVRASYCLIAPKTLARRVAD